MELTAGMTLEEAAEAVEQRLLEAGLFFGHGTDNAWDEAVWLVLHGAGEDPGAEVIDWSLPLDAAQAAAVETLAAERVGSRRPFAYLIHEAWFAGERYYVDERAIVPRSFLGEWVPERFAPWIDGGKVSRIADLCTGGGCIAVALAKAFPAATVSATDLSPEALEVAAINVERHRVGDRVTLHQGDLFADLDGRFDLIVCNPPYVADAGMAELPEEYGFEPEMAFRGGREGLDFVIRILREAGRFLAPGGALVVEAGTAGGALERRFPAVPFTWLSTASEERAVFLMSTEELERNRQAFAE
ncbi:MAG: 50S ribosomal protein L3 N(5)-glutamine methyltransferase [Pseudomonadota bacterium]|nr:50S ribosomal protein L3 N(5)-glutamine methyltransferase [Pseudomonadota bacterium]